MKIITFTCDKNCWATVPFAHQFNKYWYKKETVDVVGNKLPRRKLPDNFNFVSIGDYPVQRWTNQLIDYLNSIEDDLFIFFLEDYWLKTAVDEVCIKAMYEYAQTLPNLLRIDLTADRAQHRTAYKYHEYFGYDIIRTKQPTPYQMSYQAGIGNRNNLLKVLTANRNAWQSEIQGSKELPDDYLVLGTLANPVSYVPVLRRNKKGVQNFDRFTVEDQHELIKMIQK